ncbi:MAG: SpaH/EbpB family LPXTG-anchored major pilin, partial [Clostridia bacterium]|nr:SpaH/EbpB family LPXTG-anchored major pilin [Clostridia bacterium]
PEEIEARVSKVIDYLLAQEPVAPTKQVVSQASFVDWCHEPTLSLNTDGTYDVKVAATVDVAVDPSKNDNLTLTAVVDGHPQHFAAKALADGKQTVELVIQGIPADLANDPITLNIDGEQFAEDVFMFLTEGGREAAQPMIGYHSRSLPVHASVTVEPERVINFYKTDRVITITEGNQETYVDVPLEGIQFDLYFAASYSDYISGKVQLPEQDKINLKDFTTAGLHYPKFSVVTDENGKASISLSKLGFVDGVYIVAERPHPAIEAPVKPFYVILPTTSSDGRDFIYQVQVAPKNDVKGDVQIEKDVIELKNDEASWDASVPHTWIISASVPLDLAEGKSYVISDTLDTRLDFMNNVRVTLEYDGTPPEDPAEAIEPLTLAPDTDYKLKVTPQDDTDGDPEPTSFTVSLTKAGMTRIAAAVGAQYDSYKIRVYYDAAINKTASMGEKIPNRAALNYTNSVNFAFERESDIPVIYTCGISVLKHDSSDESKALSGAVFRLAKKVDAGTEGAELLAVADQGTIPVQYVSFYTTANMSGERADRVTTDKDGRAILYGLAAGTDYYLVEVSAPLGYNKLSLAIPVTLDQISHLTVPTEGAQAVEGPNVKVENRKGSILPDTGGIGVIPLYALGSVLCIGTGIVLCRRKGEED